MIEKTARAHEICDCDEMKDLKMSSDLESSGNLFYSRWYEDDGSGGTCPKCDRKFGCDDALEDHQEYCPLLLEREKKAKKAGVFEEADVEETWLDGRTIEYLAWTYAETCSIYLKEKYPDRDYKLVRPGFYNLEVLVRGVIAHLNFKAKAKDGPVETFFAQLRIYSKRRPPDVQVVDCCVSLGCSQNVPLYRFAYLRGCNYCKIGVYQVHHPDPSVNCVGLDLGHLPAAAASSLCDDE